MGSQEGELRFIEIEHKFVIESDFDVAPLFAVLEAEGPIRRLTSEVKDTYFIVDANDKVVYRHRIDSFIQQLTLKSTTGSNEARTEVNLELSSAQGDQSEPIRAFLHPLGILWQGSLAKSVEVFYMADAEICFYRARYEGREVSCIEIEASNAANLDAARQCLKSWEKRLGLDTRKRSQASLLELLVLPSLPSVLRARLQKVSSPG